MTIIALLVGVSLVSFDGIRKSARDSKRKADLETIRSALEIYRTDCRTYPGSADFVIGTTTQLVGQESVSGCTDVVYLETIPTDTYSATSQYYYYRISGNSYVLCAHLENSDADEVADCGSNCGTGISCNYAAYNP